MIHALVLAALSTCGDAGAQLQNAQTLLTHAQSMIDAKQPGAAEPYHQAAAILDNLADIAGTGCDPNEYALTLFVSRLRALIVATEVNEMQPLEAYSKGMTLESNYEDRFPTTDARLATLNSMSGRLLSAMREGMPKTVLESAHSPTTSSCSFPNMVVEINYAVTPDFPDVARPDLGAATAVVVKVLLDKDGGITGTTIANSSGNTFLDKAALGAAAASTYLPAVKDCRRVSSSYLFHVTFDPNG